MTRFENPRRSVLETDGLAEKRTFALFRPARRRVHRLATLTECRGPCLRTLIRRNAAARAVPGRHGVAGDRGRCEGHSVGESNPRHSPKRPDPRARTAFRRVRERRQRVRLGRTQLLAEKSSRSPRLHVTCISSNDFRRRGAPRRRGVLSAGPRSVRVEREMSCARMQRRTRPSTAAIWRRRSSADRDALVTHP
jgi:hypothetical protein